MELIEECLCDLQNNHNGILIVLIRMALMKQFS